ncbi:MAG: response regulator [Silicimonas sp.]|jgi:CheY-like chemotaxis protein|nr:response regulator [Silicimonas sp.]
MSEVRKSQTPALIERLAIIDDAEFDQMLYARLIKRTGLIGETLCFYSAEEAIEFFESPDARPVDVILLDINMPGMSGFEFLDHVSRDQKRHYADIVIIMLTTSLNPSDVERAKRFALVKDYFHKPLEEAHIHRIADILKANGT